MRVMDGADPGSRPAPLSAPVGAEHPAAPVTSAFPAIPADMPGAPGSPAEYPGLGERPPASQEPSDVMTAEMAGWASGELPGQASEQLASWVAGDSGRRRLGRSRSAR
jgi:hypothetical protein